VAPKEIQTEKMTESPTSTLLTSSIDNQFLNDQVFIGVSGMIGSGKWQKMVMFIVERQGMFFKLETFKFRRQPLQRLWLRN